MGLRIPIIILTTLGEEQDVARGMDFGANDYVTKPMHGYNAEELTGRDARVLAPQDKWRPTELEDLKRGFRRESVNIRKDGTLFPVQLMTDFITDDDGQIIHIVTTCEDITDRKRAEETIRHKAYYDDLTDLPNRLLLNERLERAISEAKNNNKMLAVMLIDLDRFNTINNSLDHDTGYLLISSVAGRLQHCVRSRDMVSRLGGDEFLIMLQDLNTVQEAVVHANKFIKEISRAFSINGLELYLTASIGISIYPGHGENVSTLIKNADSSIIAMRYRVICSASLCPPGNSAGCIRTSAGWKRTHDIPAFLIA